MGRTLLLIIICTSYFKAVASSSTATLGAQATGMGAISATHTNLWSTYNNPAGIGKINSTTVGISYQNQFLVKELSTKALGFAHSLKVANIGIVLRSFGYSQYQENQFNLAFGKSFDEKLSIGFAANFHHVHIADSYGDKLSITSTLGILSSPVDRLSLGLVIINPTRTKLADYNNEKLPTLLKLAGTYTFSEHLNISLATEKDITKPAIYKTGLEYTPRKAFFIRIGISNNPTLTAFGIGYQKKRLRLNVSSNYQPNLGISPQIAIIYEQ